MLVCDGSPRSRRTLTRRGRRSRLLSGMRRAQAVYLCGFEAFYGEGNAAGSVWISTTSSGRSLLCLTLPPRQTAGRASRLSGIGATALPASKRRHPRQTRLALPDLKPGSFIDWQREAEYATRPLFGNSPESTTMRLDDRATDA